MSDTAFRRARRVVLNTSGHVQRVVLAFPCGDGDRRLVAAVEDRAKCSIFGIYMGIPHNGILDVLINKGIAQTTTKRRTA